MDLNSPRDEGRAGTDLPGSEGLRTHAAEAENEVGVCVRGLTKSVIQ